MALGNFDYVSRDTTLIRNKDGVRFGVSDFTTRVVGGRETTVLILVELNEAGYTAGKRKFYLADTPTNRAAWSRA